MSSVNAPGKLLKVKTSSEKNTSRPKIIQNLKCQICGRRFIIERHLQEHLRQKHSDNAPKTGLTQEFSHLGQKENVTSTSKAGKVFLKKIVKNT